MTEEQERQRREERRFKAHVRGEVFKIDEADARRETASPEYAARVGRFTNHSADLD